MMMMMMRMRMKRKIWKTERLKMVVARWIHPS